MFRDLGILIAMLGGFLLAVFIYLIPSLVAALRSHPRRWSIFMLNLFLGWTVVGWVVALVGSLKTHQQTPSMSDFVQSVGPSNDRLAKELTPIRVVDNPDWRRLRLLIAKWVLGTLLVVAAGLAFLFVGLDEILAGGYVPAELERRPDGLVPK